MKNIITFTLLLLAYWQTKAQSLSATRTTKIAVADTLALPKIAFETTSFDFGVVKEGQKVEHTFVFENKGSIPLVINQVRTTCGCTATKWTKNPVEVGAKGEITVKFDTRGKHGHQTKAITVVSNAIVPQERLFIKTTIVKDNQ